jgi:glycosyltransferase involved in cell wall biosynthesis
MSPTITVIIPTYNRAHCIGRAIQSVLAQTFTAWELIVVDDGSSDGSAEALAYFGDRIRIIHQANAGPAAARNTGARAAHGQFLAFLDSDDEWAPEKLESQVKLMASEGVILSATNWRGKNDSPTSPTGFSRFDFAESWVCERPTEFVSRPGGHNIMLSSWLVQRNVLLAVGGFDSAADPAEDNHLLFRLSFKGRFALTNKVLLFRETGLDEVKLSRPGELIYVRKVVRGMCLAAGNARMLAFNDSNLAQRQFGRLYSYYLRREMELAALDGNYWAARRRAMETLLYGPDAKNAIAAFLGFLAPVLIQRRMRNKYPNYQKKLI